MVANWNLYHVLVLAIFSVLVILILSQVSNDIQFPVCSRHEPFCKYGNDPKFSDRYVSANSADPDQTAPRGEFRNFTVLLFF